MSKGSSLSLMAKRAQRIPYWPGVINSNQVGNEDISTILEEGIAHCYFWSNPRADESFFDFVRANDDGRIWNFGLLENLWNRYNLASSLDKLDSQAAPTAEGLGQMSDEEIEKTLTEARKLRARNQIR